MDATDLARWTRFATKGGIGKCTAVHDCVAERLEDLMFLKDDEIIVLLQLPEENQYLGFCEGVVGRFNGSAVQFHGKLKKPVLAKRQSGAASRPVSLSSRSPRSDAQSPTGASRQALSPSPPGPSQSPVIQPGSRNGTPFFNQPSSSSILATTHPYVTNHDRVPSSSSSVSYYSNYSHNRKPSQSTTHDPGSPLTAIPPHIPHGRKVSVASSQSAYSSQASRTSSRAESHLGSGSEETFTNHTTVSSPILASLHSQPTPSLSLSDGPSPQSSFLPSPLPATTPSFFQPTTKSNVSPLSIFRNKAASERFLPQTEPLEIRERVAGDLYALKGSRPWPVNDSHQMNRQGHDETPEDPMQMIDALETTLASIYSEPSGEIHEKDLPPSRQSQSRIGHSILVEEEDNTDDDFRPKALAASPDNIHDAGYEIGMQLLREDSDSDSDDQGGEETINTSAPTALLEDNKDATNQGTTMQQTLIRVLNADDGSSIDEDVFEEDDSNNLADVDVTATNPGSLAVPRSPNDTTTSGMILDRSYVFPRPPTTTLDEIRRSRPSSTAHTEDENWESDADIYDDYRYSRYSTYSSSPAQYNSRRASRVSTKSGWSKSSERPPMPDEESWKKALSSVEADEESLFTKYLSDRGTSTSASGSQRAGSPAAPVTKDIPASSGMSPAHPFEAGEEKKPRTPSPVQVVSTIRSATMVQSVISPLTRAFRNSMESRYSDGSGDEKDDRRDTLTSRRPELGPDLLKLRSESKSPESISSVREKQPSKSPSEAENPAVVTPPRFRVDVPARQGNSSDQPNNSDGQSPADIAPPPSPQVESHLRVDTPNSHSGSGPPSPLQPGFPPSPSAVTFPSTSLFDLAKSSSSPSIVPSSLLPASGFSSSSPRNTVAAPAIPFVGTLPPGSPPAHMQQFQQGQLPPQFQQPYRHGAPPPPDSIPSIMHMAIRQRAPTIQGHTRIDLTSSAGPVPISFILPGMQPPPSLMPTTTLPRPQPAIQHNPFGVPIQDTRSSTPQNAALSNKVSPTPSSGSLPSSLTIGSGQPPGRSNLATRSNSVQISSKPDQRDDSNAPSQPLPRANFFPKVGQPRPRSRSFSEFSSEITDRVARSLDKPRSQDEGGPVNSSSSSTMDNTHRPHSPLTLGIIRGKPRPSHGPSPLSLPPTTNVVQSAPNSPMPSNSNPLSRMNPFGNKVPSSPSDPQDPQSTKRGIRRQSPLGTRGPQSPIALSPSSISFPIQRVESSSHRRVSGQTSEEDWSSTGPTSPLKPPVLRNSNESERTGSGSDAMSPLSLTNHSPASSLNRHTSLRPKLSIPTLRSSKSRHESSGTPMTPTTGGEEDTVQIKDTEFELVKPISNFASEFHYADESASSSKDALSLVTDVRSDSNGERQAGLLTPSSDRAGGMVSSVSLDSASRKNKGHDPNIFVQAHRDRELKWISLINSTDASQARKNKRVKKLLLEGVPSSVRYLVWAHVINSGSKKIANVYGQLSKRRPPVATEIERDVKQLFPDNPQLSDPNESLVSVLFAFIAMVPDLRYHRGLTIIAGHLLLQSPEEDAFWTFLAMMDSYLRPYFMPTSPLMTVDTSLFVKAVEAMDHHFATRLFAELNVRPLELCGVWFSSVFAGSLPLPHLHRVWDLFFYDGIPFLFRVGLAILSLARKHLMSSNVNTNVPPLQYLLHPPPDILPSDPDQFIALAYSMKLKDDDIRKSRVKMEASAKQQQRSKTISHHTPVHPHLHGR